MTIIELGEEYSNQVKVIEKRISELEKALKRSRGREWKIIRDKITKYEKMKDDCMATANKLCGYYETNKAA